LPAQGVLRPALGLSDARLGLALLRRLARCPQVATPGTLREVRPACRGSLGPHRVLLPPRQQGRPGLRRGTQQQDPHHPKASLWVPGRRLPAAEDPDLYPPEMVKSTHTNPRRALFQPSFVLACCLL